MTEYWFSDYMGIFGCSHHWLGRHKWSTWKYTKGDYVDQIGKPTGLHFTSGTRRCYRCGMIDRYHIEGLHHFEDQHPMDDDTESIPTKRLMSRVKDWFLCVPPSPDGNKILPFPRGDE